MDADVECPVCGMSNLCEDDRCALCRLPTHIRCLSGSMLPSSIERGDFRSYPVCKTCQEEIRKTFRGNGAGLFKEMMAGCRVCGQKFGDEAIRCFGCGEWAHEDCLCVSLVPERLKCGDFNAYHLCPRCTSLSKAELDGELRNERLAWEAGKELGKGIGYKQGFDAGLQDGLSTGKKEGYEKGYEAGYDEGLSEGRGKGFVEGQDLGGRHGYRRGYDEGYRTGHRDGEE